MFPRPLTLSANPHIWSLTVLAESQFQVATDVYYKFRCVWCFLFRDSNWTFNINVSSSPSAFCGLLEPGSTAGWRTCLNMFYRKTMNTQKAQNERKTILLCVIYFLFCFIVFVSNYPCNLASKLNVISSEFTVQHQQTWQKDSLFYLYLIVYYYILLPTCSYQTQSKT